VHILRDPAISEDLVDTILASTTGRLQTSIFLALHNFGWRAIKASDRKISGVQIILKGLSDLWRDPGRGSGRYHRGQQNPYLPNIHTIKDALMCLSIFGDL
jgi:hypothetical protein